MKMQTTETTQGEGGGLREPGTYHVVVNDVREGESQKGKPIEGVTVTFEVLDGTVKGQQGKTHTESFFMPTMQDNEKNGDMKLRKLTAMAIAGNLLQPTQLGTEADIPFVEMLGKRDATGAQITSNMQMVVKFDHQMEMDGEGNYTVPSKYIQVSYSDFFHVDDPVVSAVPKNADALSLILKEHRHPEAWFAFKKKRGTGQPRPMATTSKSSDASDIF